MLDDRLTQRVNHVLSVLMESNTNWISRHQLAIKLGRKQLNQLDIVALTVLESTHQIEVERRPDPRPVSIVYYYRINSSQKNGPQED